MAQQNIAIGPADGDAGDDYFTAFTKTEANFTDLYSLTASGARVIVSELADFPTPSAGVITLVASTQYFLTESVSLGSNRIVFSEKSTINSVDRSIIFLTYSGTGDMLTFPDVTATVSNINIDCPSGRFINWSDTTTRLFGVDNVSIQNCNKLALFTGMAGIIRFTNVAPLNITSDGCVFFGNFTNFLYDVSLSLIFAGSMFDLGTATFNSFIAQTVLITLGGTSTLLKGATGSANINANGSGLISTMRTSGPGTRLSGITVDDALWDFAHNDDIADTRPDGLLSMQSNAINTVIAVSGTAVLLAGPSVVERASQFTGTASWRETYNGGKPVVVPITARVSIEPVSGTNKTLGVYIAINGAVISSSLATARIDSNNPTNISCVWQEELQPGDFVEVFVSNETDTTDVLGTSAVLRIN